ncbi:MAG: hypothetical protein ACR2IQ_00945, partial [Minisyncoccia bacterium]
TAVLVNASWNDPSCPPSGCNTNPIINTSLENQFKAGNFSSVGFVDNSIFYGGLVASMKNIESAGRVVVGTLASNVTNEPAHVADFRVVTGSSWFKNPVSIGNQDLTESNTPSVTYDLQLEGTTNIGRGDYCTLRANQLEDSISGVCPSTGIFGPSFMNWYRIDARSAGPNTIAARCGKLVPTSNSTPQNLGACYTTEAPTITGTFVNRTGYSGGNTPPAACATKDLYTISTTVNHDDATPLVYEWRYRNATQTTNWTTVSNANSSSINISIDKHGWAMQYVSPQQQYIYEVKLTDSLNQTTGWISVQSIYSVYRPNTYTENGNTYTCS